MNFKWLLGYLFLTTFIITGCKTENNVPQIQLLKTDYHFGDSLKLNYQDYDSIVLSDGKRNLLDSAHYHRGFNYVSAKIFKGGNFTENKLKFKILSHKETKKIPFELIKTYKHNNTLFTQGLEFRDNVIYESAGLFKKSKVVKYTLGSSHFKNKQKLADNYFAEGITVYDNFAYVLTWTSGKIFKLDKNNFKIVDTLNIPKEIKEGWGIAHDSSNFYISNGSDKIYRTDKNFNIKKAVTIVNNKKIFKNINELEFHNGFLYANVWQENIILKINPENGEVLEFIDLTKFVEKEQANGGEVLNGITFLPSGNLLFTGKNWNNLYEIKIGG